MVRSFSDRATDDQRGEQKFGDRNSKVPAYDPYEFSPFKLSRDKIRYLGGYTPQEAYGIRFGNKHSKVVTRHVKRDTIVALILAAGMLGIFFWRHSSLKEYEAAFQKYMQGQQPLTLEEQEKVRREY